MARIESDKPSLLKIRDNLSQSDIELYYRTPTPIERQKYGKPKENIKKGNLKSNIQDLSLAGGKAILVGIGEKCFGYEKDGKTIYISSDPESPDYEETWKKRVIRVGSDLVQLLGRQVFYGSGEVEENDDDDDDLGSTVDSSGDPHIE